MPANCKCFLERSCFVVRRRETADRAPGAAAPTFRRWNEPRVALAAALAASAAACGTDKGANPEPVVTPEPSTALIINEVMASNAGAWIDERGETDDWLELVNQSRESVRLGDFWLEDGSGARVRLSGPDLAPGERRLFWADDDESQGAAHLPFKLSSEGDVLRVTDAIERVVDEIEVPALEENEVFARFPDVRGDWAACRYASPDRDNGAGCIPPEPPSLSDDVEFEDFTWPQSFPPAPAGLSISELALRPAAGGSAYVELLNRGADTALLSTFSLRLSTHSPSAPWPGSAEGEPITLPAGASIAPGARLAIDVSPVRLSALEADSDFEGVLTLFDRSTDDAVDRVDFMSWPEGATLMQAPEDVAAFRYCENQTRGEPNECEQLPSRPVGDRLRHLRTPGDYAALASGSSELDVESVKFVVDLAAPGLVHMLGTRWPLHYTFVRERVYLEPALDRCDPAQSAEFNRGWSEFSSTEYYRVEGRRFLLGTLSRYAGTGLQALEYTYGDAISGAQMRDGFFAALAHVQQPAEWVLHPQDDTQVQKVRSIEGSVPLVGPNAPFEGVTYQPLTEGIAYGTLRFIPASELGRTALGPDVIVVTDDVPNDIPFVGGLITEAFQTPLAHVNVLSQNRGTPNASLKHARSELADALGTLVRLDVGASGLRVRPAEPDEALAYWEANAPSGPLVAARLDTSVRGVQPLQSHGLSSLPAIGAKAAQLAELGSNRQPYCGSSELLVTPDSPFAVPLVHFVEHMAASGARERLDELRTQSDFSADPRVRADGLAEVRRLIQEHPVEADLLEQVEAAVQERFGQARVRFRSSSNTEDLPGFNGAGLYTSTSAELGDDQRRVEDAMRTVWASLYNARAYDERSYARIDDSSVAMGILVHPAFLAEQANGVAVSRNILDPTRGDIYYLNAQTGEASVTNPAPGTATEQLVYRWGRTPPILYQSDSSLLEAVNDTDGKVLSADEIVDVSCALYSIHEAFRPLLDPSAEDPWFAMEVEFKFIGPERRLLIKQARPHSFGRPATFTDCREL